MRSLLLLALCSLVEVPAGRAADGRFFLFVADGPPSSMLVKSTRDEARRYPDLLEPPASRERIAAVFPRLFATGLTHDRSGLEAELKLARAAHFRGQYKDADAAFERALETAAAEPELLDDAALAQRLVDGAARRYRNTIARRRPKQEARDQIAAFLARYPMAAPTASDHAPEVIKAWNSVRTESRKGYGAVVVNVLPLELDRGGTCKLVINGMVVADLPQSGPLSVPRGDHLMQVRCGLQASWLQRITVGDGTSSVRVPVRAMLAARGDTDTGGVVLVAPEQGDGATLNQVLSEATGLLGAVAALASEAKIRLGVWDGGADEPKLELVGDISGRGIDKVEVIRGGGEEPKGDESSGRVWTWVVGGLGVATLGAAVATNVVTADKIKAGEPDTEDLKTTTIALYAAGGVLLATGIILFFVESDSDTDGESAGLTVAPGGVAIRF